MRDNWAKSWHTCFCNLWYFLLVNLNSQCDSMEIWYSAPLSISWSTFVGDNFFKSVSYTIEVVCAEPFTEEKENLRAVEAQILSKRVELSKFETEYREVCAPLVNCKSLALSFSDLTDSYSCFSFWQVLAQFTEMTSRYAQEMQAVSLMLWELHVQL